MPPEDARRRSTLGRESMKPYIELPGLAEVVLEESYVLGIRAEPSEVMFEIDFVLTRAHPAYAPPPSSERECFRKGHLRFLGVRRLVWAEQGAPPATDARGEPDYGNIESLEWDEPRYVLAGDWGHMDVTAREVQIDLDDPT
jgi:hypothetical protein